MMVPSSRWMRYSCSITMSFSICTPPVFFLLVLCRHCSRRPSGGWGTPQNLRLDIQRYASKTVCQQVRGGPLPYQPVRTSPFSAACKTPSSVVRTLLYFLARPTSALVVASECLPQTTKTVQRSNLSRTISLKAWRSSGFPAQ